MEKSVIHKPSNLMKHVTNVAISAAFAALVLVPSMANADYGHAHCDKSKHSAFMDKRQNELHDKLALSASQESAWKDFVAKTQPEEHQHKHDWSEFSKLSTPDRLDRILAKSKERQQVLESRVQAIKNFYGQLTSDQKKTFDESFHFHGGWHGWHHHHRHEWHGSHE